MSRINWSSDPTVIVRRQDAVAIYENDNGEIVIRQQGEDFEDDDVVVIAVDRVDVVIAELIGLRSRLMEEATAEPDPVRLTAAVVRELIAAGLSDDRLAAACERIEAGPSTMQDVAVQ